VSFPLSGKGRGTNKKRELSAIRTACIRRGWWTYGLFDEEAQGLITGGEVRYTATLSGFAEQGGPRGEVDLNIYLSPGRWGGVGARKPRNDPFKLPDEGANGDSAVSQETLI